MLLHSVHRKYYFKYKFMFDNYRGSICIYCIYIPTRMVRNVARLVKNIIRTTRKCLQEHLAYEGVYLSLNSVSNILHEAEWDDALERHCC